MFVISLNQTTPYRLVICSLLAVTLLVSGCDLLRSEADGSSVPDIRTEPLPSLEKIPFDALGNGTIAFQRMHNLEGDPPPGLYVIDGKREETHSHLGGTLMYDATVSSAGKEVAFRALTPHQSDREAQSFWDVYLVRLDGSGVHQISSFPGNTEGAPTWTPDGSKIVFPNLPNELRGPLKFYAQPPTSSEGDRELLHEVGLEVDSTGFFKNGLAVSPDRKIAFVRGGNRTDYGLEVLTPSSNTPTRIYEVASDSGSGIALRAPAWSPNGTRLAFLEVTGENGRIRTRVRILKLSDRSVQTVATVEAPGSNLNVEGVRNFSLCWTRTGSTIAFTRPDGTSEFGIGTAHVYAVPAAGGEVVRVTSAGGVIDYSVSCP